jgi:putative transposase
MLRVLNLPFGPFLLCVLAFGLAGLGILPVKNRLERRYGQRHLHFITCSCYRRLPFLRSIGARNLFVQILGELRVHYRFKLVGLVVMPEHFHLLIGEPNVGTPSTVLQILKQRVSRKLRQHRRKRLLTSQLGFWHEPTQAGLRSFWQRRFYDFNVWTRKKKVEKLNYMHMNPVKRGLVTHPKDWPWSSHAFYAGQETKIRIDAVD